MPVYFIRAGVMGDVKIGVSTNPLLRLRGLQTSHPQKLRLFRLLDGDREAERKLHERFSPQRKSGEWFAYCGEMAFEDLGFSDLPLPFPKRKGAFPDSADGKRRELHSDVLAVIGGVEALSKRLGIAPWDISWGDMTIVPKYYAAAVVMARDAGYAGITTAKMEEFDEQIRIEHVKRSNAQTTKWQKDCADNQLKTWLKKNGRDAAWWPLTPEDLPSSKEEAA